MRYVYLLQSLSNPGKRYVGSTDNLKRRLTEHNRAASPHTAQYIPWKIIVAVHFEDDAKADAFERYLKQGTGHAFAKRHFW
jgi:putative endonuclease